MEIYCTRPNCPRPQNYFPDLDDTATLRTVQQKFCTTCGMPLILEGRYMPTKLLGRGGFGAAFLARDRRTPRLRYCVVKQFLPAGSLSPTQMQLAQDLFEREAVVLEDIGHQHEQIPDLFAFFPLPVSGSQPGQQDQFFYIVQEYIDGQNLEEELDQKGKFSEPEALEVLREILKILKFVHNRGIIHRDIKPSNIMRDRQGKFYLLDFGAVKLVASSTPGVAPSSTGIYSLGFAPPEQMAGSQVFPSTDLYALAVTIVMLLTGEKDVTHLFDAYTNQWNWRKHVNVNPRLAEILDRMLLSAASQRYQSAQDVLDALDSLNAPVAPTHVNPRQPNPIPQTQVHAPPNVNQNTGQAQPVQKPPSTRGTVQQFSLLEILVGAGFSGFEGGLVAIAAFSVLKSLTVTLAASALILGILIFLQTRRWIEKWDLLIIAGISFAVIFFVPFLHKSIPIASVIVLSVGAGLMAIAFTALFRLIYKLLSLLL